ncbi:MAG: hypothetical protein KAS59_00270 [Alphaproteobacteria bacterium]|nr:hypothetical protein [Alphaproteobacteria bacterium]
MINKTDTANQNISFSSLICNPQSEIAEELLATVLYELEHEADIAPSLLSESLFKLLMIEMEPDDPITTEKAFTWIGQLHRFRDAMQAKINAMEKIYSEDHD